MKYWRILTLVAIGLIMTQFYAPPIHGAPKVQFSIVYTNDVMGEVEPCG